MKRSEMLGNIAYILKDSEELSRSEIAEAILELQEELGINYEWGEE